MVTNKEEKIVEKKNQKTKNKLTTRKKRTLPLSHMKFQMYRSVNINQLFIFFFNSSRFSVNATTVLRKMSYDILNLRLAPPAGAVKYIDCFCATSLQDVTLNNLMVKLQ